VDRSSGSHCGRRICRLRYIDDFIPTHCFRRTPDPVIGAGWIARRRAEAVFAALGRGDWDRVLADLADPVHHVFPGDHPLGGVRHSRAAVGRWFERLARLFPGHEFEVEEVLSKGPPWDLWIVVRWTALLTPAAGPSYENRGTHWIRVRWSRVTHFHAHLDTQRIAEACALMAEAGIEEAAAEPIVDEG
jgi:ketosteroid isomerase-like protein